VFSKFPEDRFSAEITSAEAGGHVDAHAKRAPEGEAGAKAGVLDRDRIKGVLDPRKIGARPSSCQEAAFGSL